MLFVVFIPRGLQQGNKWPQAWHSIYLVFSRFVFAIGIILVILPTLLGIKNSFFRTILDTRLFNFLAKISFCVYLVHYIVLSQIISYKTYDIYYFIEDILV
jgi:peptidoglycan/LPS O-acetylase OafA/YrhL